MPLTVPPATTGGFKTSSSQANHPFRTRAQTTNSSNKLRVLVLGSRDVGKTSIIRSFIKERFVEDYRATDTDQQRTASEKVVVELMDTDNVLLPHLKKMAIRTAEAFVLVYAVDNQSSFDNICSLRNDIIEIRGKDTPIVVVGNKVDVSDRSIHPALADCVVTIDWECPHIEISTKNHLELSEIFTTLFKHPKLYSRVDALLNIFNAERRKSHCPKDMQQIAIRPVKKGRSLQERSLTWGKFRNLFRKRSW